MSEPVSENPSTPSHQEHLIDDILPARELHLVAGPSGAGKTTWMIKMIDQWRQGQSIFGHASHPRPFMYLSLDRSRAGVLRIFDRLKIDHKNFHVFVPKANSNNQKLALAQLLKGLIQQHPDVRVFFIEGFQSRTPDGKMNDYKVVAHFLLELQQLCEEHNITIIGVAHASKAKQDEKYLNPRERVNGTVAWAAYSETIIVVEPEDPDDPENRNRRVMLLPRNAREQVFLMENKDGTLVEKTSTQNPVQSNFAKVLAWLAAQPLDRIVTTTEICAESTIPTGSINLELTKLEKHKALEMKKRGTWQVRKNTLGGEPA